MFGISPAREYRRLAAFYDEVEHILAWPDARLFGVAEEVSRWSRGHHLYHIAVTNGAVFKGVRRIVEAPEALEPGGQLNVAGRVVLTLGRIPRGRGRAPKAVAPPDVVERTELARSIARNRAALERLEPHLAVLRRTDGRFPHPYFGHMNAAEWLRFARIHSRHHLAIVRDVERRLAVRQPQP